MSDTSTGMPFRTPTSAPGWLPQRSFGLKLLLVCVLALLMAIPALFVFAVVYDRSSRAEAAVADVSGRYGGEQVVMGPALAVPWSRTIRENKETRTERGLAVVYAETGTIDAAVDTQVRKRGIHDVPVYEARVRTTAEFQPERFATLFPDDARVDWRRAALYMSLSDTRGVMAPTVLTVNGETFDVEPTTQPASGSTGDEYGRYGQTGYTPLAARFPALETFTGPISVTTDMQFSGAEKIGFAPFARETTLALASDWDDPSFTGAFQYRDYDNPDATEGFTANWVVPYEARGIPGAGANISLAATVSPDALMAVSLVTPNSPYQSVQRALKYALMFIGFVFLAYFLFEVTSGQRAHPAQYVLVGLAQSVFYLLLLALAEQAGFDIAFLIAAVMTVVLTSGYAATVFASRKYGWRAMGILTGVYALIYVLMRLEDYALLVGALASFTAIALTMWMTRDINWYGGGKPVET